MLTYLQIGYNSIKTIYNRGNNEKISTQKNTSVVGVIIIVALVLAVTRIFIMNQINDERLSQLWIKMYED